MTQSFPSTLGRYQVLKYLAHGGMAQVLLARATGIEGFERHVVLKRIHGHRAENPAFVQMFLDEARLAAQLHHHNIVQVHDIGKERGEYFFAMEYVHGEDLRKLLMTVNKQREKVPFEHVVTIITSVALALHHAHEQRGADRKPLAIVHRDVSPANIIVGYDGNVKVVDFGIAKAAARAGGDDTKNGALKGKVSYMSPEQCAGQPVDRRSDVYSLGIVLFELATVRRLFKGANDFLTMSAIVRGKVAKPSSYRPDIPPELEQIIYKALAVDPDQRYQSADEMREALEQFAAARGLRTSTGSLASYMKQLFGHRPEPWLVDEPAEPEAPPDFDAYESGAVKMPEVAPVPVPVEPTPSSPLARAKADAEAKAVTTSSPPPVPLIPKDPVLPDKIVARPPKDDGWTNGSPTTGSALAWPTDVTGARPAPTRKRMAIAGVVAAAAVVVIVVAMRGGDDERASSNAAASRPAESSNVVPPAPPAATLTESPTAAASSNIGSNIGSNLDADMGASAAAANADSNMRSSAIATPTGSNMRAGSAAGSMGAVGDGSSTADRRTGVAAAHAPSTTNEPSTAVGIAPRSAAAAVTKKPAEANTVEKKPIEQNTVVTKPGEKPSEKNQVVTKPVEKNTVVTKPVEKNPPVTKPVEKNPAVAKPGEKTPVVAKPIEKKPPVTKPVDKKPPVTKPVEKKPPVKKWNPDELFLPESK